MRRLFWLALGATVGVLIVRKLTQTAERLTPKGLAESFTESLSGLGEAIRDFGADVRAGMSEREAELYAALETEGGDLRDHTSESGKADDSSAAQEGQR